MKVLDSTAGSLMGNREEQGYFLSVTYLWRFACSEGFIATSFWHNRVQEGTYDHYVVTRNKIEKFLKHSYRLDDFPE